MKVPGRIQGEMRRPEAEPGVFVQRPTILLALDATPRDGAVDLGAAELDGQPVVANGERRPLAVDLDRNPRIAHGLAQVVARLMQGDELHLGRAAASQRYVRRLTDVEVDGTE